MPWLARLKTWARTLKRDIMALYLATRDPATPWPAKAVAFLVAAYAFSPIDLIPDFIPVLGYLDDLIILPLGIALAIRLIPAPVLQRLRQTAEQRLSEKPVARGAAIVVVLIWIGLAAALAWIWRGR